MTAACFGNNSQAVKGGTEAAFVDFYSDVEKYTTHIMPPRISDDVRLMSLSV